MVSKGQIPGLKVLKDGFTSIMRRSCGQFGTHTNFRNSSYLLGYVISQKYWQGFRLSSMTEIIKYTFTIPKDFRFVAVPIATLSKHSYICVTC